MSKASTLGLFGPATVDEPERAAGATALQTAETRVARRLARQRRVRWGLAVVASLLIANALAGERGVVARLTAGRTHADLVAGIEEVRRENAALRERIRRLREDPGEIEAIARRELGLMRPGERVFVVKRPPAPSGVRP
ncbi:MAG: septum formation initiator family protein [Acidobacteria bacterium]|nr:septum formation initiator family protein [Acidobacteriota bacterium]